LKNRILAMQTMTSFDRPGRDGHLKKPTHQRRKIKRFGVRIVGYVLMANHYHLQIGTPQANLRGLSGS